jgi:hypothetical protein
MSRWAGLPLSLGRRDKPADRATAISGQTRQAGRPPSHYPSSAETSRWTSLPLSLGSRDKPVDRAAALLQHAKGPCRPTDPPAHRPARLRFARASRAGGPRSGPRRPEGAAAEAPGAEARRSGADGQRPAGRPEQPAEGPDAEGPRSPDAGRPLRGASLTRLMPIGAG